jgi:hypothetical protein
MSINQPVKMIVPKEREDLKGYTNDLQRNLESIFFWLNPLKVKDAAPSSGDGQVGDQALFYDGTTARIYYKVAKDKWAYATLTLP